MIKDVYYYPRFKKSLRKLEVSKRREFEKNLALFIKNPFDPRLNTHKLKGKFKGFWSFSVTYADRVVFEFLPEHSAGFVDVGPHNIYE